jgi:signal transduction histidine kinase/HPt (histidine-containing phosphotransfer) domain-containing protein
MVTKLRASLIATIVAIFLVAAICATVGAAIWIARQQAIEDWQQQVDKLSLVLAEQTSQEVRSAVLVLDSIADSMTGDDIFTEAQMRGRIGSASWFASLRDKIQGLPQVDVASIVAANGDLLNFTRVHPAPAINVADRSYFEVHQQQGEQGAQGVYIGAPVRNRSNGEWTFYLSRRLNSPGGEFLGVALVGFSSTFLADFYQKINLGQGATVLLSRHDGMLMARWPHDDQAMGTLAPVDGAGADRAAGSGARLSSSRQIDKYGMAIRVSVPDQLYLAQWRRFTAALVLAGAVSVAAILAAFVVLVRSLRRREEDMENMRALQTAAEASNRAKSAFLAMMSHEIRTPLTAIIGFADVVQKEPSPAGRAAAAAIIGRHGQHLLDVINDMLDISKIEAERLRFEQLPFSPVEVAASVAATMQVQAHARGIAFSLDCASSLPSAVMGDPTRFRQILFNLCGNAVKFTEQGAVELSLDYERASNTLLCTISDSGIGMSADELARLFQPFVQADSSVARKYGGTGLGLYLVQQLLSRLGGQVTVDSVPGQGSVFRVTLPAAPAPGASWTDSVAVAVPAQAGVNLAAPPAHLHGHILLAEDNIDNRRLVGLFLERAGLSHEAVGDGAAAVELAMTGRFDLVLMDIRMPVMDGVQALRLLRERGFRQPVIALTANLMEDDLRRYADAGFDRSIGKPIDFEALHAALGGLLPAPLAQAAKPAADGIDGVDPLADIRAAFRASLGPRLSSLEQWVRGGQWQQAAELAHQLRGAGGSFGYPGLSRCTRALETAALAGDAAGADAALAELLELDELRSVSAA